MWIQPPNNWNFIPEMMEGINLRGKARNGYPPRVFVTLSVLEDLKMSSCLPCDFKLYIYTVHTIINIRMKPHVVC